MEELLQTGAQIDHQDRFGETALMKAALMGHEDCVRKLLKKGAAIKIQDNKKRTAMSFAAQCGNVGCLRMLLSKLKKEEKQEILDAVDESGRTPLDWATSYVSSEWISEEGKARIAEKQRVCVKVLKEARNVKQGA
jgi:ankyrin repeat protein